MTKKKNPEVTVQLDKIVGGGQTIGTLDDGKKIFAWGGLPGEKVNIQITKKKSKLAEGFVTEVIEPSADRIKPRDENSYLSTSPWQIMSFESEQNNKIALIKEAFELSDVNLPNETKIYSDNQQFEYRNKIEFSWYWNKETEQLDLAFFKRGSHNKIPVDSTSLANPIINKVATKIRNILRKKENIQASILKTLLIRSNQKNDVCAQLYVKDAQFGMFSNQEIESFGLNGFEVIFSNPQSPASVITKRLQSWGIANLNDEILSINFNYAVESFFQINIPVYEKSLIDIQKWVDKTKPLIDLYSGVGTIGLTVGSEDTTLIEINENAVNEMKQNIKLLGLSKNTKAILSASENALEYIDTKATVIVDPPRAGLHDSVIEKLLETGPQRIIYLSCNPVTQGRDIKKLLSSYEIAHHTGYNFFPRTPHIEHLVVLQKT